MLGTLWMRVNCLIVLTFGHADTRRRRRSAGADGGARRRQLGLALHHLDHEVDHRAIWLDSGGQPGM